MNMQTAPTWMNAVVLFIVGLAQQQPTLTPMPAMVTGPALGDQSTALLVRSHRWIPSELGDRPHLAPVPVSFPSQSDDLLGNGGTESTLPCATGDHSTPCEQYIPWWELDPEAYAAASDDCGCLLITLCKLTGTFTDFISVIGDDGNVVSTETIVSCEYGGCGVEIDL